MFGHNHPGYCRYCGQLVYWHWDTEHGRPHWAPPFESIYNGAPRGPLIRHRCRWDR